MDYMISSPLLENQFLNHNHLNKIDNNSNTTSNRATPIIIIWVKRKQKISQRNHPSLLLLWLKYNIWCYARIESKEEGHSSGTHQKVYCWYQMHNSSCFWTNNISYSVIQVNKSGSESSRSPRTEGYRLWLKDCKNYEYM
jgi:hypothetical protein